MVIVVQLLFIKKQAFWEFTKQLNDLVIANESKEYLIAIT